MNGLECGKGFFTTSLFHCHKMKIAYRRTKKSLAVYFSWENYSIQFIATSKDLHKAISSLIIKQFSFPTISLYGHTSLEFIELFLYVLLMHLSRIFVLECFCALCFRVIFVLTV